MGGTDIVDQRSGNNTTSTKSRKWTRKVLCYILDVTRINAQTVYCLNNELDPRKYESFSFATALGMSLLLPHMTDRRSQNGIQEHVTKKMDLFLPRPEKPPNMPTQDRFIHPSTTDARRRCTQCLSNISSKAEKQKLAKNLTQCQRCSQAVCKSHSLIVCSVCSTELSVNPPEIRGEGEIG